jgi:TfoX/Sxy family transcriptional regulator of competence genes
MAEDEILVARVRAGLAGEAGVVERRMMGGLAFLKDGNMLGGVVGDRLFVRVGAEGIGTAVELPHVAPLEIGGRPTRGFVTIAADGLATEADLQHWIATGLAYASSLPAK